MTHLVNYWTPEEDTALRLLRAAGMSWEDIGAALGHPWASAKERLYQLRRAGEGHKGGRPKGAVTQCRRHPMGTDPCIGMFCKEFPKDERRRVNRKAGYFLCESCRKGCATVWDGRT